MLDFSSLKDFFILKMEDIREKLEPRFENGQGEVIPRKLWDTQKVIMAWKKALSKKLLKKR